MLDRTKSASINVAAPAKHFKGANRLRIALVGMPNSGKQTLFNAVASTSVHTGELVDTQCNYRECRVQVGHDEADVIVLPSLTTLQRLQHDDLVCLKYLLWGNQRPAVSAHENGDPPAPYAPPNVIIQVVDATALESHLELTLELTQLGKPLVIALNMMDQASDKGMHINIKGLSKMLGVPVVPTTAVMGNGIQDLFDIAVDTVRHTTRPTAQLPSHHIQEALLPLSQALDRSEIHEAFQVSHEFLLNQFAAREIYFVHEIKQHFPDQARHLLELRENAEQCLPRPLDEELHADRHHRAASIYEAVTRFGASHKGGGWTYWLDELFLHPRWGLLGSLLVFAAVLFVVFEVSAWLDSITAAQLVDWAAAWQPTTTTGVVGRAVLDGLIGLVGIVLPYMIPLVMLLVALEESGIMHRIAFVVDRWFHHLGLHGAVAVPFLLGLGCNVPALSATAAATKGRERVIASVLVTFVPCSARSAVILALAGKYLGGLGIFAIFMTALLVIALVGHLLSRYFRESRPGQIQQIPPYAMPQWRSLFRKAWFRTRDILTIVTPLLVIGSVILALLGHFGADKVINTLLTPITSWWLGLPVVLGVPILFGILRKELSLLMVFQALGTFEVGQFMDWVQIMTFLIFLTFYFPCVSTFAVMLKTIGYRYALLSVAISVTAALFVSGIIRALLETARYVM
ncbi:MAG: ferrous iron transporter B [Gammaproteobacteria bacterium]|jgi:ferrous iron transport protein B